MPITDDRLRVIQLNVELTSLFYKNKIIRMINMSNANSSNGKEKSRYGKAFTALSSTSNKVFIKDGEWRCSGCLEVTKQENFKKVRKGYFRQGDRPVLPAHFALCGQCEEQKIYEKKNFINENIGFLKDYNLELEALSICLSYPVETIYDGDFWKAKSEWVPKEDLMALMKKWRPMDLVTISDPAEMSWRQYEL